MLKKTLILITIMFISGCGDDSPEPKVSFEKAKEDLGNAADKLENKAGDLADSAKNVAGKMGSTAGDLAGSAKDAAGNTLDAAGNVVGGAGTAVGDLADSANDAAGNALDAAGNVVDGAGSAVGDLASSAKDAAGNTLDAAGNVVGGACTAVGDLAGSAKDAAGNALNGAVNSTVDSTGNSNMGSSPSVTEGSDIDLEGVTFKFNSSELESGSFATLDAVARKLDILSNKVEIAGYTDNVGSDAANREISKNRAKAVLNYLSSKGIASDRLSAKGYGSESPIADNNTEEGRLANRRVELQVQ